MKNMKFFLNKTKQYFCSLIFNFKKIIRLYIFTSKKYKNLLLQKNKYKNKRCFIIATGPSLKLEDVQKLENEITFGVNSLCLWFNQMGWKSTFLGIQDERAYKNLKETLVDINPSSLILSDWVVKKCAIKNIEEQIIFPLNFLNHHTYHNNYGSKFSNNAYKEVFDGYSITFSMIQIAAYMGFKEIYLLGADCNYDFADADEQYAVSHGIKQENPKLAGYKMVKAYESIATDLEKNNIHVYNATRGGMLEVFERVNIDEIVKKRDGQNIEYINSEV